MNPTTIAELYSSSTKIINLLKTLHLNQIALETIIWNKIEKHNIENKEIYWTKNGKKEGLYKWFYSNEQICEESVFKNDKREGPCKLWYSNGQIFQESVYKNDKKGSYKSWWSDGVIAE